MAFPAGPLPASASYAQLDHRQRRLLDTLARSPSTWLIDGVEFGNVSELMRSYALPDSRDVLQTWVNGGPRFGHRRG
jgi:hypothetical protein